MILTILIPSSSSKIDGRDQACGGSAGNVGAEGTPVDITIGAEGQQDGGIAGNLAAGQNARRYAGNCGHGIILSCCRSDGQIADVSWEINYL